MNSRNAAMRMPFALLLAFTAFTATAEERRRALGSFKVGMTLSEFRLAAAREGLVAPRMSLPEDRDVMGLGVMRVQTLTAESQARTPDGQSIWRAAGLLVSDHVAMIEVDYGTENMDRRDSWLERFDAPKKLRREVQDLTWHDARNVYHIERYGRAIYAVDWSGLSTSNRIMVSIEGAVRVANEYFRRALAREAEISLEYLKERITTHFAEQTPGEEGCVPIGATDYTPGESACLQPDHRFPAGSDAWRQGPWKDLAVDPTRLSRYYSFLIESSGTGLSARIAVVAMGDLDCDDVVSTTRLYLRPDPQSGQECRIGSEEWETIDLFE